MKIAIISDLHGNSIALRNVLKAIEKYDIKKLLIAGDFLGYYYDHKKLFQQLEAYRYIGIQGNHDTAFEFFINNNEKFIKNYNQKFGKSLEIAKKALNKKQANKLLQLPVKRIIQINGKKFLLCHGSPWDQDEYIYPDAPPEVFEKIASLGYDYVIMGHTHYPIIKKIKKTLILNPGSIGQPRDVGSHSSWIMLDVIKAEAKLNRIYFDPTEILKQIETFDSNISYLKDILLRKKS